MIGNLNTKWNALTQEVSVLSTNNNTNSILTRVRDCADDKIGEIFDTFGVPGFKASEKINNFYGAAQKDFPILTQAATTALATTVLKPRHTAYLAALSNYVLSQSHTNEANSQITETIGSGLGAWAGTFAGSALLGPVVGPFIGRALGSAAGGLLGGALSSSIGSLFENPK